MKRTTEKALNQKGGFLSDVIGSLIRISLPLMKNVLTPLAKSVLIPLAVMAVASARDAAFQKKIYGSGMNYTDNLKQYLK